MNNCYSKPCLNGGSCVGVFDSNQSQMDYKCKCPEGYEGTECELGTYISNLKKKIIILFS